MSRMILATIACLIAIDSPLVATELALPLAEATSLNANDPETGNGGAEVLELGDQRIVLMRFQADALRGHTGTIRAARLELTMPNAGQVQVQAVSAQAGGWQAGQLTQAIEDGAACWNYLGYSSVKHIQTGEPFHRSWPSADKKAGKGWNAACVGAELGGGDGSAAIALTLGDQPWSWASTPRSNYGLALTGTGSIARGSLRLVLTIDDMQRAPGIPIAYSLPRDGRVSLNVINDKGGVVKQLLAAAPRTAGQQLEVWDGTNDKGDKVEPGSYRYKALLTDGLTATYVGVLGMSVPLWETWPGNHIPAVGVDLDDAGEVYLAAGCSESFGMLLKMSPEGERRWTMDEFWFNYTAWQGGHSVAHDGEYIYLLQENYMIQRVDAGKGWSKKNGPHNPRRCFDVAIDPKKRSQHPDGGWGAMKRGRGRMTAAVDFDVRDRVIVVSYHNFDRLRWIDPDTKAPREGKPTKASVLHEVNIPKPQSVTLMADGRALVITEGRVVAVQSDGTIEEIISAKHLVSPYRIAVHPSNGDIYVAERGDSQQVVRFSAAGKQRARYGIKGGRAAQGRYDAAGFREVSDLAVAADGSFWITEAFTAPRRTAHFSADGKLVKEWYGGQMYANRSAVDLENPEFVWFDSQWGELVQAKVDWTTGDWSVYATYSYMYPLQFTYRHEAGTWHVRHRDGQTYLCNERGINVMRVDEANRRLVPVTKYGDAYYPGGNEGWRMPESLRDFSSWDVAEAKARDPSDKRSHKPWHYIWSDLNSDGVPSQNEITFGKELLKYSHVTYPDKDMNYIIGFSESLKDHGKWVKFANNGLCRIPAADAASGVQYDFRTRQMLHTTSVRGVWVDPADGDILVHTKNDVRRLSADGTFKWRVGRKGERGRLQPGEVNDLYRPLGVVHGAFATAEVHDGKNPVFDRDGLWVGRLLEQPVVTSDIPPEAYKLCGENFGGFIFEHPKTGVVYFLGGGVNATPIYRIDGWDRFVRLEGDLRVDEQ
ncbi:MAG: hypothetical protein PF961_02790 [Planctomycetota bacterium]|jgi:hypothetical protein|nr:hypothetical protein [Planctomycetota bacterium]